MLTVFKTKTTRLDPTAKGCGLSASLKARPPRSARPLSGLARGVAGLPTATAARPGLEPGPGTPVAPFGSRDSPRHRPEDQVPGCLGAGDGEDDPHQVRPLPGLEPARRPPPAGPRGSPGTFGGAIGPPIARAHPSPLEERDDMPTATTVRRITPAKQRNFGRIYDVFPVPDLTEIQTRSYERFLQADIPAEQRIDSGLEGVFREIFPIESYRQDAEAGIHQVRPGQAALRARRVPPAPPDLRPAAARLAPPEQGRDGDRGVGLPRRHADHDRRRRVHHQRRRARRRQPAPPLARASTSSSRSRPATASSTPAGSSPSAGAGSSSRSPRRRPSASGSTSRASSRR